MYTGLMTLTNGIITLGFRPQGVEMTSLVKDGTEYIWQTDFDAWDWHAPLLFPQCGNYPGGYEAEGTHYVLSKHGFARDFVWTEHEGAWILTDNEETRKAYPWKFLLKKRFILSGSSVTESYELANRSQETMPYAIGQHTAYLFEGGTLQREDGSPVSLDGANLTGSGLFFPGIKRMDWILKRRDGHSVRIQSPDCTTAIVWTSAKGKGKFLCVEPRIDTIGTDKEAGYPFRRLLRPGESVIWSQTITILS